MSHGKKTFGTRERGRAAEAEGKRERERGGRRVLSGILLSSRPLRPRNEAVAGRRRTWDIILHARNSKRRWGEKEVARLIIILTWSGGGQSRELKHNHLSHFFPAETYSRFSEEERLSGKGRDRIT